MSTNTKYGMLEAHPCPIVLVSVYGAAAYDFKKKNPPLNLLNSPLLLNFLLFLQHAALLTSTLCEKGDSHTSTNQINSRVCTNIHLQSPQELLLFFKKPSGVCNSLQFGQQHGNIAIPASYPGAVQRKNFCRKKSLNRHNMKQTAIPFHVLLQQPPAGLHHAG